MKTFPVSLVALCLAFVLVACGDLPAPPVPKEEVESTDIIIGSKHRIQSDILGEERAYWISTPRHYDPSRKYPYVYLLDARDHFEYAAGTLRKMGGIEIPEFILVGIPNTNRTRDLTPTHTLLAPDGSETEQFRASGGGDNFLAFIETELAPAVEADYPGEPYRMLIGHSFGGIFALHASLERPDAFASFIVIDPSLWWDGGELITRLGQKAERRRDFRPSAPTW